MKMNEYKTLPEKDKDAILAINTIIAPTAMNMPVEEAVPHYILVCTADHLFPNPHTDIKQYFKEEAEKAAKKKIQRSSVELIYED